MARYYILTASPLGEMVEGRKLAGEDLGFDVSRAYRGGEGERGCDGCHG